MVRVTATVLSVFVAIGLTACGSDGGDTDPTAGGGAEAADDPDTGDGDDASGSADTGGASSAALTWNGASIPAERIACMGMSQFQVITTMSDDEEYEFTIRTDGGHLESVVFVIGGVEEYYAFVSMPSDPDNDPPPSALDALEFEAGSHTAGSIELEAWTDEARDALPDGGTLDFDVRC